MPEIPVKEIRLSELHLPEIKREDIVRSLSEIKLPSVDLPAVQLPGRARRETGGITRFDWRSIDLAEAMAGMATISRLGRPMLRRSRVTVAAGAVLVVGLVTVAVLANPTVRERAARTARRVRDRAQGRMTPSDVLEVDDDLDAAGSDATEGASSAVAEDLPSGGELVSDDNVLAPDTRATDGPMDDAPSFERVEASATEVAAETGEPARPA
jgi:hypothetical protein